MADDSNHKVTEFAALTTPAAADLIHVIDDVAGTPTNKKVLVSDLILDFARTQAEIDASVVPTNLRHPPGNVLRYGTNSVPGTTDMTTAIQSAIDVMKGSKAGTAVLPNESLLTSGEILIDANVFLVGQGSGSRIKPNAETFAAIRVESAVDNGMSKFGLRDFDIEWATQATNSAAVGIKFDDSGGVNRFPDGGHIHRVDILRPFRGFMDDTIAFNIDIKQMQVFEPREYGIFCLKTTGTMYGFDKVWVIGATTTAINAFFIQGIQFLKMTGCAVDNYNGAVAAIQLTSCSGVIDSFDIENSTSSGNALGLMNLFSCTMVVNGRINTNTISGVDGAALSVGGTSRITLDEFHISNTTATGSNNTHAITVSNPTSLLINGGQIDVPTGGSGSHTDIIDVSKIHSRFDENGLIIQQGLIRNGATPQTLTGAGAVDITSRTTLLVTTGTDALTLANGAEGQEKSIVMKTDGGVGTLTPTNLGNGTTIVFDDVGDFAELLFTNSAWHFLGGTATLTGNAQTAITFTSTDATPTVGAGNTFITAGTTPITDFDDGVVGQTIKILGASTITITDGTPIQLFGSVNFGMVSGDTLTLHMFNDQVWEEIARSITTATSAYTRNATIVEDRTLLASASATATNNNNVLAALIADLTTKGIIS